MIPFWNRPQAEEVWYMLSKLTDAEGRVFVLCGRAPPGQQRRRLIAGQHEIYFAIPMLKVGCPFSSCDHNHHSNGPASQRRFWCDWVVQITTTRQWRLMLLKGARLRYSINHTCCSDDLARMCPLLICILLWFRCYCQSMPQAECLVTNWNRESLDLIWSMLGYGTHDDWSVWGWYITTVFCLSCWRNDWQGDIF